MNIPRQYYLYEMIALLNTFCFLSRENLRWSGWFSESWRKASLISFMGRSGASSITRSSNQPTFPLHETGPTVRSTWRSLCAELIHDMVSIDDWAPAPTDMVEMEEANAVSWSVSSVVNRARAQLMDCFSPSTGPDWHRIGSLPQSFNMGPCSLSQQNKTK